MSKGNLAWKMNGMSPGRATTSTRIDVLYETSDGVLFGVSNLTAISQISALRSQVSMTFAPGCQLIINNATANALATVCTLINIGSAAEPVLTQVMTAI